MIAVVADSHIGQQEGGLEAFLATVAALRRRGLESLYLLGDIFQYLIGDPKFGTPQVAEFLRAVRQAREEGSRVFYVEGNRDFFLRGSYLAPEFDAVAPEASFTQGGRRFLLVHGDGINERDWPYRCWRFLSKNPVSRRAARILPRGAANRFVAATERRLRDSNFKHKSRLPVEMIRAFAQRRLRGGFDVVLLGHFHHSWRSEVAGGSVEIVPPFLEERRWVEIDAGGRLSVCGPL